MVIDKELMDQLSIKAKMSPKKRISFDLRNTTGDKSQRMLNVLDPATVMTVHRHRDTNEFICLLRGCIVEYFYNDKGEVVESFTLKAGSDAPALLVPAGVWHELECMEEGTILVSVKDGPYKELEDVDKLQVKK